LNKPAIEILNQWKRYNHNQRFVFDLMEEDIDFNNRDYVFKNIASKNRTIQTSLNSVGEKMNLPFSLNYSCNFLLIYLNFAKN